jgi:PASTA domain/F5/8 type C domain
MRLWPTAAFAPSSVPGHEPRLAIDSSPNSDWNAGTGAPVYITVDLGRTVAINKVRLQVNQYPDGNTRHEILVARQPSGPFKHVATLDGWTVNGQWLELNQPIGVVRYLRVETTESPSWVSWREIEIFQSLEYIGYFADAYAWVGGGSFTAETHAAGANFTFIGAGSGDPVKDRQYILNRLSTAHGVGGKAFVDLTTTLFNTNGRLLADWRDRWYGLADAIDASGLADTVIAFYPHDEVYWWVSEMVRKGVPGAPSADEMRQNLSAIAAALKGRYPQKPIADIMSTAELDPAPDGLGLDRSHFAMFDWLGFDSYCGKEPRDAVEAWLATGMWEHIDRLGSWLDSHQRLIAVPEAWWQAPNATPADEDVLVERIDLWYGELLKDGRYVAVTSFLWYAEAGSTGTRSMPRVKERLRRLAAHFLLPDQETEVPDVREMNPTMAARDVRAAGLIPTFVGDRNAPDPWVVEQQPPPGTIVDRETTVTLTVTGATRP